MTIDELAKEIADALSAQPTTNSIYRTIRWWLKRGLPKIDRPPLTCDAVVQYVTAYIALRKRRHPMDAADEETIREDLVTVLSAPSVKEPRYYVEAFGGGYWRVVDRVTGVGDAYFSGPKAEYCARAHAAFVEVVDRTPSMRTDT